MLCDRVRSCMCPEVSSCVVCREGADVSAVCVFSLADINKVLDGPFKELKKYENWINPEPVPTPRPGQVRATLHSGCKRHTKTY